MSIREHQSEILELLSKYGAWIAYVCVGLIGTFGLDIVNKKKLSVWYIFATSCMGLFVGFISSRWFMLHNPEMGAYCVPVFTLVSRDILIFFKLIDWQGVMSKLTRLDTKKDK